MKVNVPVAKRAQFPAGRLDSEGNIEVPAIEAAALQAQGFAPVAGAELPAGPTSARPTAGLLPGHFFFDLTLNRPVWRNKTNTGWVDATGTAA